MVQAFCFEDEDTEHVARKGKRNVWGQRERTRSTTSTPSTSLSPLPLPLPPPFPPAGSHVARLLLSLPPASCQPHRRRQRLPQRLPRSLPPPPTLTHMSLTSWCPRSPFQVNPIDDIDVINLELALADLAQIEKRMERLKKGEHGMHNLLYLPPSTYSSNNPPPTHTHTHANVKLEKGGGGMLS
eukprot:354445-Chlamydomonas_euryale.AAC.1